MSTLKVFLFHLLIFHIPIISCIQTCKNTQCPGSDPTIRFPFHLKESHDQCRAYNTTFDLSCNEPNQTIISLPTGDFTVQSIDYMKERISINDPENCLARQFLTKNFTVEPVFQLEDNYVLWSYTFLNCTPNVTNITSLPYVLMPIRCLSGDNYTVAAVMTKTYTRNKLDKLCNVVSESMIPIDGFRNPLGLDEVDIVLTWNIDGCELCEVYGQTCGFKNDTSLDIGCSSSEYYPPINTTHPDKGKNADALVAVEVLVVSFLIGVICLFTCCKTTRQRSQQSSTELTVPNGSRPVNNRIGLDKATVESYPKTVLSETSKHLLDLNNNVCSICLSDYQPGETNKTIPSCEHYFHVHCIDQWLLKKATCPLCRDLPRVCDSSVIAPSLLMV